MTRTITTINQAQTAISEATEILEALADFVNTQSMQMSRLEGEVEAWKAEKIPHGQPDPVDSGAVCRICGDLMPDMAQCSKDELVKVPGYPRTCERCEKEGQVPKRKCCDNCGETRMCAQFCRGWILKETVNDK